MSARYRVDLASGGSITVKIEADVFALDVVDRQLVFDLVDLLKERGVPQRSDGTPPQRPQRRRGGGPSGLSDDEKRTVVQRSYETTVAAAAREADVHRATVENWRQKFPEVGPMERRPFDANGAREAAASGLYDTH
ncbi:MAG TPA: hypothetical protein VGR26_14800 [Acidimicrobiales bacterium]|nr:hypothetical protein [Acidimicrobiales bacterium]